MLYHIRSYYVIAMCMCICIHVYTREADGEDLAAISSYTAPIARLVGGPSRP